MRGGLASANALPRAAFVAASLLLLAACAAEPPQPTPPPAAAAGASSPPPAAAAVPAGPVTEFDGRYVGRVTLNPDRTRACPPGPASEREIIVRQGRASFPINPEIRQTLAGTVARDGSARMTSMVDRSIATTGLFTHEGFIGEHRNGLCSYAVRMTKQGG